MKKFLFLCIATVLGAFASSSFSQTWTPTPPKGCELKSSGLDTVYLYNVGAAQFLNAGNAWGTHAKLAPTGLPIRLTSYDFEDVIDGNPDTYWNIFFFEGAKSKQLLYNDDGSNCYVDHWKDDATIAQWAITEVGDYYRIQSIMYQDTFDPDLFVGHNPEREDRDQNGNLMGTNTSVYCDITEDEGDNIHIDWLIVAKKDYEVWIDVNGRKQTLAGLIEMAQEYGVEPSKAITVLEDENATATQVQAAIDGIKAEIISGLQNVASEDDPIDVTSLFLINPDFNGKSTEGWTLTGAYAQTQNNNPWYIEVQNDNGDWVRTDEIGLDTGGWLEFWKESGLDADQDAHQVIKDLPAGSYTLELVGFGLGAQLYAITNGIEQTASLSSHLEYVNFSFTHVGGDLTFGVKYSPSNNTNWVTVDKFRLKYLGEGDNPLLIILNNELATIEPYYDESSDDEFSQTLFDELKTIYDNAEKLIGSMSSDEAATKAAIDAIHDIRARIGEEAAAYTKIITLIEVTAPNDVKKYQSLSRQGGDAYEQLCETIEAIIDGYQTKRNNRTYTKETIDADIDVYKKAVKEGELAARDDLRAIFEAAVAEGKPLDYDLDITPLFDEMDYSYNTFGVNYPNIPDTLWQNATGTTNFKTWYGTAEVWDVRTYDIYREISLPKGKYTITVNAFYQEGDPDMNYMNYMNEMTEGFSYLYAGNKQTVICSKATLASETEVPGWSSFNITDEMGEQVTLWAPYSQATAHEVFTTEPYAEQTLNRVSAILSTDGILRFGIKSGDGLQARAWTIWEGFHIYYNAASASDYNEELEQLMEQIEGCSDGGVLAATDKIDKALVSAEKALTSNDVNVKRAAIDELREAIDYAEKATELVDQLMSALDTYIEKLDAADTDEIHSYYTAFVELIEEMDAAVVAEDFESNEQMEGWLESLPVEWAKYLAGWTELDKASVAEPVDFSVALMNPTFDYDGYEGWTAEFEKKEGNDTDGCVEFWNSSNFDFYQELALLRPGFYRLSVNAFYRAGWGDDEINVISIPDSVLENNAYLYAGDVSKKLVQWSDLERGAVEGAKEELQKIYPGLDGTEFSLNDGTVFVAPNSRLHFESFIDAGRYANELVFEYKEGQGPIRLGVRKDKTIREDWVAMDNFVLEYFGNESPDAVRGIAATDNNAPAAIYNLAGQKVNRMQAGIYIVNGHKVVKR